MVEFFTSWATADYLHPIDVFYWCLIVFAFAFFIPWSFRELRR